MRRLLLVLMVSLLLTGCSSAGQYQKNILERLGVISAVGYDRAEGEKLLGTVVLPNFTETGQEKVDVLTATGRTSKEMRYRVSLQSERKLVAGQIRVVLYGEELAKEGILPFSDTLFRDAEIGSQIHLAVVKGRAADMLMHRYPDKPSVDLYLYQMLRKEMELNTIPKSNLHVFIHDAYDAGGDPVLPYLKLDEEDVIMDGVGVFRDDKLVGKLNAEEARTLAFMYGRNSIGEIDVTMDGGKGEGKPGHVVMMYLKMNRQREAKVVKGIPHFQVKLEIEGAVTEYTGQEDLEDPKIVRKMEAALERELEGEMKAVSDKLQHEFRADPLGYGELFRSKGHLQKFGKEQWNQLYQKAKIDYSVKIKIKQTGMIH